MPAPVEADVTTGPVEALANPRPSREAIAAIYHLPLLELVGRAAAVHRRHNDPTQVQVCVLLSVKTGGCPEDCGYCPQSARYDTPVSAQGLMEVEPVLAAAEQARAQGATRFCMGAAWREAKQGDAFERVLEMVRGVKALGLEACCTLGMLNDDQARRLKEAGLDAYNHNLDSSPEFYDRIITTRTYADRLETLDHVRNAGISVCCGGIVGMGETDDDRIGLLHALANLPEPPESVPVNALVPVDGTPLEQRPRVDVLDMVRMIATARILFPQAMVRLSAGRVGMSESDQALCFLAGANSIFAGDKLLTTPNPGEDADQRLFQRLGLVPRPASV
ncbi:MAG: biotin synthase BioB [Isosphaeraceae bacterium]